jgi:Mrp family chromosome partitioning ATPase
MNRDSQIQPYAEPHYTEATPVQHQQVNVFKVVHKLLRGRYVLTVLLAFAFGAAGAVLGWTSSVPKYRAEAMIRIQPVIPKILYETDQSNIPPMFASFVNTQANLLRQQRTIDKAINSSAWKALGRPPTPATDAAFRDSLKVTTARDTPELIFVSFVDEDARAAFTAVGEIVHAYEDLETGGNSQSVRDFQVQTLSDRRTQLETQRRDEETQINRKAAEFETSDLDRLHDHYLQQQLTLDTRVGQLEVLLAERGIDVKHLPAPAPAPEAAAPAPPPRPLSPEEIALHDKQMAEYVAHRETARQVITRLQASGVGEKHQDFKRAMSDLTSINSTIETFAKQWNEAFAGRAAAIPAASPTEATEPTETLVQRFRLLSQQAQDWRTRTEKVNSVRGEIEGHRREITRINQHLAEVNQRLDAITLEGRMEEKIGRVNVFLPDAPPSSPTVDPRKKLAAFGLVAGAGFPIACMLLLGFIDRRLRYSDQADGPSLSAPMLGVLPHLPTKSADPAQVAAAVHGVHHIRTLLQLSAGKAKKRVYAITSPTAGDGKTSLALSLAMSFSASGSRTALVDFDLVGQGLSTRLKLNPQHGIGEAVVAGRLNGTCTMHTPFPGLTVLGPRPEEIDLVSRFSSEHVLSVIEELRESFDTVIIDTGPILGSLEAAMAASVSDGVVLVVGRGQHQPNIQSALSKISQLRATCVGLVFNRAHSTDFNRSAATMSMRSIRTADIQRPRPETTNPAADGLDPLARSMAAEMDRPALQ